MKIFFFFFFFFFFFLFTFNSDDFVTEMYENYYIHLFIASFNSL